MANKTNPNLRKVKRHRFCHGNYKIVWKKPHNCEGLCSDPTDRIIHINPKLDDKELLRVCLDEAIHANAWNLDNDYVAEMSDSMAEFLYKIGFRLEKRK